MQLKKGLFAFMLFIVSFAIIKVFSFSFENRQPDSNSHATENVNFVKAIQLPQNMDFAGEKVPLNMYDVAERMDRELTVNVYWQSQTILFIKRANRWFPIIEPILKKYNIPNDFKYLAIAESGMMNAVSPAGATGFWQLLEAPAKQYGLLINDEVDERYNVEKATEAACKYLSEANTAFGSWTMAAASYNMGITGLRRQVESQKQSNYYNLYLNEETARYIFRLMALKEVFEHPARYNFKLRKKDLYPAIPVTKMIVDSGISNMADFAAMYKVSYKTLKLFNPWMRQPKLINKERRRFTIQLPDVDFNYERYLERMGIEDSIAAE